MTKIKICGLSCVCDIETVNQILPEYIGFVFYQKSKRYITAEKAVKLKSFLSPDIMAVGVFVNDAPEKAAEFLNSGIIDIAQLHGEENENYIKILRGLTNKPIIKAFSVKTNEDIINAQNSSADYVLLDSGNGGTGKLFDWNLIENIKRPYFLAGGLNLSNIKNAVEKFNPYAVDVSSGVETNGFKDKNKICEFVQQIRKNNLIV